MPRQSCLHPKFWETVEETLNLFEMYESQGVKYEPETLALFASIRKNYDEHRESCTWH